MLAMAHGIYVIADDIYEKIIFDGQVADQHYSAHAGSTAVGDPGEWLLQNLCQ